MIVRLICLTIVCLVVAGCASINANSDYDESADFASYRTYGWISEHPLVMTDPSASPLFDVKRRQPVWHGWAVKTISSADRANPSPVIREVIETILAQFPPQ